MTENILIKAGRKIKHLPAFSRYANLLSYNPGKVLLTIKEFDTVEVDGFKFAMSDQIDSVQRVKNNSWFEGVRPTDIVLDIGANIGAICIPLAKAAKQVYAMEPVFVDELKRNIDLNHLSNVTILPFALGDTMDDRVEITFAGHKRTSKAVTFWELLTYCGGNLYTAGHIDFLKCDCEGAEWLIHPTELRGIRELRFEFHLRRGREKKDLAMLARWYGWLGKEGYTYDVSEGGDTGPIMPISHCMIVRASKIE